MTTSSNPPTDPELEERWLPLLQDLTAKYPSWSVWKNPESAFTGPGDTDSLAPPEQWDAIEGTFREWAEHSGLAPVIVCRHVPQGPHFITADPNRAHMLILDVKERSTWRGSTLIDYHTMPQVTMIEDRGFRRIRPGAEGVVKLVLNGVLKGGRPNPDGLEVKNVAGLLASDREGVELAAKWFKPFSGQLLAGVDSLLEGGWDRRSMATVEAWAALKAIAEPRVAISRLVFNKYTLPRCPVLQSVRKDNRQIPADADRWFEQISVDHEVDLIPDR